MKKNWLKSFTNKDQLQFHSKSSMVSRTMLEVSTALLTVERPPMMLTTQFWPQVTEAKAERTSGTSTTHGELDGELEDISKWKEEPTCAPLLNATHILLSIDQIVLKLDLNIIQI